MTMPMSRRSFLQLTMVSGALVVATPLSWRFAQAEGQANDTLTPLMKLHADNSITFFNPSPEMGQGTDTSLAMMFAEEIGADFDTISVENMPYLLIKDAEGEFTFKAVPQFSGGSTSIPRNWNMLRDAAARIRQQFLQAASTKLQEPVESLKIIKSQVVAYNKANLSLYELAELAANETLPEDFEPTLSKPETWVTMGKPQPGVQREKIVKGEPLYAMDMEYPDVKIALVARSPYFDAEIESVDAKAALNVPGVVQVVELARPDTTQFYTYLAAGVAVIADDFWSAKQGRDKLKIRWKQADNATQSSQQLHRQADTLLKGKGQLVRNDGEYQQTVENAAKVISHTYKIPTISHAQLEPQNCIAHVTKDHCTIIGPLQNPGGASRIAGSITGLDRLNFDIRYTRLGGGFGRRLSNDHVAEAVTISKLSGLPVKLIWTREDDMSHDFYRPMGHHQLTAAMNDQGKVIAWSHRLAGRPKYHRRDNVKPEEMYQADLYIDDFPAHLVPNLQYEYLMVEGNVPQGSWRAPAHVANAFVVQSFIDEVARELNRDPLELRLAMLGEDKSLPYGQHGGPAYETGRMKNCLNEAARLANWAQRNDRKGRAMGMAGHFTFGGYCAQVADVELLSDNRFKVHKVYAAIDVGTVINPQGVISQVEGAINDGLSTALGQQVVIEQGKVTSLNFDTYPMMRMVDSPTEIDVHVIDSNADPSGAGEMGIAPIAPAVANAIVAAGGTRIRSHPMRKA